MEILFWRHQTDSQKKKGLCTIYCRLTVYGERVELGSTHIKTNYDYFDQAGQKVTDDDLYAVEKNTRLTEEFTRAIMNIYNDLAFKGKTPTATGIKNVFLKKNSHVRIMDLYDRYLLHFSQLTKAQTGVVSKSKKVTALRSESTLRPLKVCRNKMLKYVLEKGLAGELVDNLEEGFLDDYETWLWELGHEQSTVVKHLRTFKQITSWGYKKSKILICDPFAARKVEKEEEKDPVYLSQDQFDAWCKFSFKNKQAQLMADIFKLYCRTAFHYEDLRQVILNPELYFRKGLDGNMWIYKPREKTEEIAKIPIEAFDEYIMPVVNKYGGWGAIPIPSNATLNDWLKLCVAEINLSLPEHLKIHERLSVKHGRTTFANWWINELGRTVESLLPILGRISDAGLRRYVRPDERAVIAAMKAPARLAC